MLTDILETTDSILIIVKFIKTHYSNKLQRKTMKALHVISKNYIHTEVFTVLNVLIV